PTSIAYCFFSSRRRHTGWPRDWSSDVCSSDLLEGPRGIISIGAVSAPGALQAEAEPLNLSAGFAQEGKRVTKIEARGTSGSPPKIGRASCRERVDISVGAASLRRKEGV